MFNTFPFCLINDLMNPTGLAKLITKVFPLVLENLEKWEGIFQSGNFELTGKVRENQTKYWKTQGISDKCYLLFLVIFKLTVYY